MATLDGWTVCFAVNSSCFEQLLVERICSVL